MVRFITIIVFVVSWASAFGQGNIHFSKNQHSFGQLKNNTEAVYDFIFKNTGDSTIWITSAQTDCEIPELVWTNSEVHPGEYGFVKVKWLPSKAIGATECPILVTYTDKAHVFTYSLLVHSELLKDNTAKEEAKVEPFVQFYEWGRKYIDTKSEGFQNFIKQAATITSLGKKIEIRLESSASKVPAAVNVTLEQVCEIRAKRVVETLTKAFDKEGVKSESFSFLPFELLVQGPEYTGRKVDIPLYETYQYVRLSIPAYHKEPDPLAYDDFLKDSDISLTVQVGENDIEKLKNLGPRPKNIQKQSAELAKYKSLVEELELKLNILQGQLDGVESQKENSETDKLREKISMLQLSETTYEKEIGNLKTRLKTAENQEQDSLALLLEEAQLAISVAQKAEIALQQELLQQQRKDSLLQAQYVQANQQLEKSKSDKKELEKQLLELRAALQKNMAQANAKQKNIASAQLAASPQNEEEKQELAQLAVLLGQKQLEDSLAQNEIQQLRAGLAEKQKEIEAYSKTAEEAKTKADSLSNLENETQKRLALLTSKIALQDQILIKRDNAIASLQSQKNKLDSLLQQSGSNEVLWENKLDSISRLLTAEQQNRKTGERELGVLKDNLKQEALKNDSLATILVDVTEALSTTYKAQTTQEKQMLAMQGELVVKEAYDSLVQVKIQLLQTELNLRKESEKVAFNDNKLLNERIQKLVHQDSLTSVKINELKNEIDKKEEAEGIAALLIDELKIKYKDAFKSDSLNKVKVGALQVEVERLEQKAVTSNQKLVEYEKAIALTKKQEEELKKEIIELKKANTSRKNSGEQIKSLQVELVTIKQELETAQQVKNETQKAFDGAAISLKEAREKLKTAESEKLSVEKRAERLTKQVEALEAGNASQANELGSLKELLALEKQKTKKAEEALAEKEKALARANLEIASLQKDLELAKQNEVSKEEIEVLKQQIKEKEIAYQQAQEEIKALKKTVGEQEEKLVASKEIEAEKQELEEQIKKMNSESQARKMEIDDLESQVELYKKKEQVNTKELEAMQTKIQKLKDEKKTADLYAEEMKTMALEEMEKRKSLEKEIAQLKATGEQDPISFRVQVAVSDQPLALTASNFKGYENISEYKIDGKYKYAIGKEKSMEAARQLKEELRDAGFDYAFIVAFRDNAKISLREAVELTRN